MMDGAASKKKDIDEPRNVTVSAASQIMNEYHFPGSGTWKALSVVAASIEEATELWRLRRAPLNPEAEKVDEQKQIN